MPKITQMTRRDFIKLMAQTSGVILANQLLPQELFALDQLLNKIPPERKLLPPDANGVKLPVGFSSRIVARSSQKVLASSDYVWHAAPDGGATFAMPDGGWIYASNSEMPNKTGGCAAIQFNRDGIIQKAYPILKGTTKNCAGGKTPWDTYLSCEEHFSGLVWECDPYGAEEAKSLPALGIFEHEAVCVDDSRMQLYMTEDDPNGLFYRFTSEKRKGSRLDLERGRLEAMKVNGDQVTWVPIPHPQMIPLREQALTATRFNGGEGIWLHQDKVLFTTKGDNRVWEFDIMTQKIRVLYEPSFYSNPELSGVDNILVSPQGEILVAEDGGNMQLVAMTADRMLIPLLQLVGHNASEITGPAFSPDGTRLYFSSQRGKTGKEEDGMTFEISGSFAIKNELPAA